jgi:hypothetical protein
MMDVLYLLFLFMMSCAIVPVCCCIIAVRLKNLSISNLLFLNCNFLIFNKYLFIFSSNHLSTKLNDGVVHVASWCVSRISFYVSLCSSCVVCDG